MRLALALPLVEEQPVVPGYRVHGALSEQRADVFICRGLQVVLGVVLQHRGDRGLRVEAVGADQAGRPALAPPGAIVPGADLAAGLFDDAPIDVGDDPLARLVGDAGYGLAAVADGLE